MLTLTVKALMREAAQVLVAAITGLQGGEAALNQRVDMLAEANREIADCRRLQEGKGKTDDRGSTEGYQ